MNRSFWLQKRVFLTGHTGFKGGWLAIWLRTLGARIAGFGLAPATNPSFFHVCDVASELDGSCIGDVRDPGVLSDALADSKPEIIFHLAAQPLVRRSYREPVETLAANIMGTVHVLEAARQTPSVRAVVVVTSDKCYQNRGCAEGYTEDQPMGGRDPYSASKGCVELVAAAYQHSFFRSSAASVATARAGNVIGGGDWAEDRIVPDAIRALSAGAPFGVRNPGAVRPWQHVLEPLAGYLMLAERVFTDQSGFAEGWNFGPNDDQAVSVACLSDLLVRAWRNEASWTNLADPTAPHEESYLKLNAAKAQRLLGWRPILTVGEAVDWTVAWYKQFYSGVRHADLADFTRTQIASYEEKQAKGSLSIKRSTSG